MTESEKPISNSEEPELLNRFLKTYSSLPIKERKNTIAVIDNEPINWKMAYREIKNKSKLGKKIGEKLIELEII